MKMTVQSAMFLVLLLAFPHEMAAQYWGERVLEKGFEQTDFFFLPGNLVPYGIGNFKSTTPGLLDDPLLNLAVNPARFRIDSLSDAFLYADFRSARTIQDQGYGYIQPWLSDAYSMTIRPYPWVYLNTRRELEPVFSGAYLGKPLPNEAPELLMGVTYQLILQDDKYYSVPQDIYRSVMGSDYAGNRAAAADAIPIVDRYSGQDKMNQLGHFVAAFGRYEIPRLGSAGVKVGHVLFDRSGAFGSSNLWEHPSRSSGTSLWSNLESRDQGYGHWELTGGAEFYVSEKTTIGATAGWLWGDATQALRRNDSSYYDYSYSYTSSSGQSLYERSGNTLQEWRHDGRTLLLGADLTSRLTPKHTLRLLYHRQRTTVDLGLGSNIVDTSYSTYSYQDAASSWTSSSDYMLLDQRGGSGRQSTTANRILASVQWQLDDHLNLALGAQFDWQTTEIRTAEAVLARMQSVYQSSQQNWNWSYGNDESKDLHWTFRADRTSFRIPIFLTIRTSDAIEVVLGLNRTMTQTKLDDVTLALFRYRQSNSNGAVERKENFGERYTLPTEEVSDVRTTFLAGLTAAASRHFRVRLLVVPNFRDSFDGSEFEGLQWWIGVTILP